MSRGIDLDSGGGGGSDTDDQTAAEVPFTPVGTIAATDTQTAVAEVATDAATALSTHEADTTNIHGITDTSALVTTSTVNELAQDAVGGMVQSSTTVTAVYTDATPTLIFHVTPGSLSTAALSFDVATQTELDAHVNDAADAHAATAITFTPHGSIAATTVQAAIQEVRDEAAVAGNFSSITFTYLTTTTTAVYVTPSGVKALIIEGVGGGGGGAGAAGSTSQASHGSGGGGGSYFFKLLTTTNTAYTYYCGSGGNGGAAGANEGNPGTTTSIWSMVAYGGGKGFVLPSGTSVEAITGGFGGALATGGDLNRAGRNAVFSLRTSATVTAGSGGGDSDFGNGGGPAGGNEAGNPGTGYGTGGSGGCNRSGAGPTARAGGNGASGLIRIWELW
jgi:hypothetical protein